MPATIFEYIEWIELETFFSGYLLVYAMVWMTAQSGNKFIKSNLLSRLPLAYALVATLYWGLQFKNWYPDYNVSHILSSFQNPYLKTWGLLGIISWIPFLHKQAIFTLLHSSVFFILLISDVYNNTLGKHPDPEMLNNDLKIYGGSVLLHILALGVVTGVVLLVRHIRRNRSLDLI